MVAVEIFKSRKPWIGPMQFDCSLAEDHGIDIELTDRPVEGGATISDHALILPRAIVMTVGISNLPDELLSLPEPTRHLRAWKQLVQLAEAFELLDVVTSLEVYAQMFITSVRTQRTLETTHALQIVVRLRKLETASVDAAQAIADVAHDIALGEADLGAQSATAANTAELAQLGVI